MEGINREIVEKKVYEEGKKEYASKGVGNAGLALGIVGTALGAGALWGRRNGIFGGGSMPENVNINTTTGGWGGSSAVAPTAFQAWEKECNKFNELDKKVAVLEATRPYQDRLIQCEIDRAFTASINYTDRKTCRAIYGVVGLPSTPTVTVLEGANPFGCNCQRAASETPTA